MENTTKVTHQPRPVYQTSAIDDRDQLKTRMNRLHIFMRTDEYAALPREQRTMLILQLDAMGEHLGILERLIDLF